MSFMFYSIRLQEPGLSNVLGLRYIHSYSYSLLMPRVHLGGCPLLTQRLTLLKEECDSHAHLIVPQINFFVL